MADSNDDDEFDFGPILRIRKHAFHYLVRQSSGQFVYKYKNENGKWCCKRLPKTIVLHRDAVEWVNVNLLGGKDVQSKLEKLKQLAERGSTDGEREAARRAISVIEGKKKL